MAASNGHGNGSSAAKRRKTEFCGAFSAIKAFNAMLGDVDESGPHFSMGLNTYRVPMTMHEGNRRRTMHFMHKAGHKEGIVLLQGGQTRTQYCSDTEIVFRQESYMNYLFGAKEPDFYGALDLATGKTALFIQELGVDYAVVMGKLKSREDFQSLYAVDEVLYEATLESWLRDRLGKAGKLFLLRGLNTDSGKYTETTATFPGLEKLEAEDAARVDRAALHPAIAEARVFKSADELRLMRYVSWVTSMAHVEVMRDIRVGMAEYQLEALFKFHTYAQGGCRHEAYTCICACGPNAGVLHYGHAGAPNERILQEGDMALIDMGAEYHCYCSDITCSYPANGKFSADQRAIFTAVAEAQRAVLALLKPGCDWAEMHRLTWRVLLEHLVKIGILRGTVEELMAVRLGAVFFPCGLGHFIGCDTHDVGGYNPGCPPRIEEPGIRKLRTARILEEGMVLTVEPGIYFIDVLIEPALADPARAKYIVPERLAQFRKFGGVRLEDVVAITKDGFENYTLCPRTCEEVEDVMAGGQWPPAKDMAPEFRRLWLSDLEAKKLAE